MSIERDFYEDVPSRFAGLIVASNIQSQIIALQKSTRGTKEALRTVQKKTKARNIKGTVPPDPMVSGKMTFAPYFDDDDNDQGTPWSEPLPDPLPNHEYYVSCELTQHQGAGPTRQLQGFLTRWFAPPGFTWTDGLGLYLYDEAISNPLYIRRVGSFGATVSRKGFRVVITEQFRA